MNEIDYNKIAPYKTKNQKNDFYSEYLEKKKKAQASIKYLQNSMKLKSTLDLFHNARNLKTKLVENNRTKSNKAMKLKLNDKNIGIKSIWVLSEQEKKKWNII